VPKCPKTAQKITKAQKIYFLVVLDYFSYKKDLVRGLFSSLDIGKYTTHLRAFEYLLGSIWGCPKTPKQHEIIYFLVV
jgi:hypothetical protein